MSTATAPESVTLYFRQGSSDKVYRAGIEPSGPGFIVNFAYGRRGSTLNTGTKTDAPVGYDEARKIYSKLVKEKTSKGYTPGENGTPYQQTPKAERATNILPMLLNPIDEVDAQRLMTDPAWLTQEKLDGKRILIQRRGDNITGINRKGLSVALPEPVAQFAQAIPSQSYLIDGECIGDTFVAFDLLEYACVDLRTQTCQSRLNKLYMITTIGPDTPIQFVRTATKSGQKRAMFAELRAQNKEGVVFKRIESTYTPGRPASGGDWLKVKFTAMASCIVAATNGSKRSVKLELIDQTRRRVSVGSVTIPANSPIPTAGQIVEIRYLYAYQGGSLYQPVYLCRRDDVSLDACTVSQLKFKASAGDDGEEN